MYRTAIVLLILKNLLPRVVTRMDTLKSGWTHYVYCTDKVCLDYSGQVVTRMDTPSKVVIFTRNT